MGWRGPERAVRDGMVVGLQVWARVLAAQWRRASRSQVMGREPAILLSQPPTAITWKVTGSLTPTADIRVTWVLCRKMPVHWGAGEGRH